MKKAIHHFSRGLVAGLEIVGVLAVVLFLAWMGLLARLSQGPLNVDFLTARVEKALNEHQAGFAFDVGTTDLTWGGKFSPLVLQMRNVAISRADGTPVLSVDRVGVRLSKRHLIFGRVVPKVIDIHAPALRVIRHEDGRFSLNIGEALPEKAEDGKTPAERADLIQGLLVQLQEKRLPLFSGLSEIGISEAVVHYEDRVLGAAWTSRNANIRFARDARGILSEASVGLDIAPERTALVRIKAWHDWKKQETTALAAFEGVNPALAAKKSEKLKAAAEIDLSLKGSLALTLDGAFRPVLARMLLSAEAGTFNAAGLYAAPIPVKSLSFEGEADLKARAGKIEKLSVDLGGPVADITAQAAPGSAEGVTNVRVQGQLADMPIDGLKTFWPPALAPDARAWVTGQLSKGVAHKATVDLDIDIDAGRRAALNKVGGKIDFTGIRVDYFPPLMPVEGVDGTAVYDHKSFSLDLAGGTLGDMKVGKSTVRITDLDIQDEKTHARIDIAAGLKGPLKTALRVLDSKPLEYPKELGIRTGAVEGSAAVDVRFRFPLYNDLALEEVDVAAEARLEDVLLQDMVAGMALAGGPMDLSVTSREMKVKGKGKLAGMPVEFGWTRTFSGATAGEVRAKLALDGPALIAFGVPADFAPSGSMPSDIVYTARRDGTATLKLAGDLGPLGFEVPAAGFKKAAGVKGSLDLALETKDGKPRRISDISVKTGGTVLKGAMEFEGGEVKSAAFGQAVLGETDVAVTALKGKDGGYVVKVTGRQLDLSRLFADDGKPGDEAAAAQKAAPLTVTVDVGRILTGRDRALGKAKIHMARNEWKRIDYLEMDAVAGAGEVNIRYLPVPGGHTLNFQAADAGAALGALGFTDGVRKGRISITGATPKGGGMRDLAGTAIMTDFTLVDAPVLARLLNALSLPGLIELLNGKGVAFKKARTAFHWIDRGQPAEQKNLRMIKLKNGETSGASLGLTFEGVIDEWNKAYDLNGTIIPVSDLNKMVSSIPIVGDILTAGGEGVFAATYTIKGPKSAPTVTVNPLAALAPGVLRKLFFEN